VNFARYRAAVEDSEQDKNGVTIVGDFDFGFIPPDDAAGKKVSATITTTQPISHSVLLSVRLASSQGLASTRSSCVLLFHSICYDSNAAYRFSVTLAGTGSKIEMGKPLRLAVALTEIHIGRYVDRAEFLFQDTQLKQRFMITRSLRAIVGNFAEHQALAPKTPYIPRERTTRKPIRDVVEGVRPPALNAMPYVGKLPMATIPSNLSSVLDSSKVTANLAPMIKRRFMPSTLNTET
jgi:helicase MOV-10